MKLVLLRHATRSAFSEAGPAGECPLNTVGLAQAEDLINHIAPKGPLPSPTRLLVSPKLRARQTLTPLSRELALKLEVEPRLDERESNENFQDFTKRMRSLFTELCVSNPGSDNDVIYLCTHMDWLEAVGAAWPTNFSERETSTPWTPLEYQVFRLRDQILNTVYRGRVAPRF